MHFALPLPGHAQEQPPPPGTEAESLDARLLYAIYHIESRPFRTYMRAVDATAYPVFFGSVPASWSGAWLIRGGGDWSDAYRLTVSEAVAFISFYGLKQVFERPRPGVALRGFEARLGKVQEKPASSFPSGHTTIAFALATSWSLSHPGWYNAAPSMLWAFSLGVSRIWMGRHYPSDVLGGMLLGIAVGAGVHALGPAITPGFLEAAEPPPHVPPVSLVLRW